MNKTLKVMTSAALLAGVVAPVAVTTVDAANTKNLINKVLYVADDYTSKTTVTAENFIQIKEDDVGFTSGDTFRLSLPSGVKWVKTAYTSSAFGPDAIDPNLEFVSVSDRDLELKLLTTTDNDASDKEEFNVPLYFEVDGAEGELKLTLNARGSSLSSGTYTFAVVGEGSTSATIDSVKTIRDGGRIDTIRLDENSLKALYADRYNKALNPSSYEVQEISLTLPSDFDWKLITTDPNGENSGVVKAGGFADTVVDSGTANGETLGVTIKDNKLYYKFYFNGEPDKLGTFYIENLAIDADRRADFGEIEVDLDGDEVTSGTIVVAKYGDFGTTAELEGDVPTLLAGRLTDESKDVETVEVLIKETVAGSWLPGRSVDVEFPSWVKVIGVDVSDAKNFDKTSSGNYDDSDIAGLLAGDIEGDSNEISFDLPSDLKDTAKKKELKVKFYVSTKADVEGDVTVKVDGRAGIEIEETVIAKVVSPVKVENEKVEVRTGIKEQNLNDIILTEATKGALIEDKEVVLTLPAGVYFTDNDPEITVEEGNVKIKSDSIDVSETNNKGILKFEIDGESTRASKIQISGLALDLNRSVPEGDITVEVGGDAIVQNSTFGDNWAFAEAEGNDKKTIKFGDTEYVYDGTTSPVTREYDLSGKVDAGEFDRDYVAKITVATVVTPADGNATVVPATFTIGSTTYKVGDVEKAMDVAPFVEAGRTYMPVRYVAEAVGVTTENILWDQATQTATFIKDARVAQVKVGSNVLVVNGANIAMDAAAKVVDGRTVIPVRFVAQALGANVDWNEADQTVTVK